MSRADRLRLAFLGLHPERARLLVERWGGAGGAVRAVRRGDGGCDPARLVSAAQAEEALAGLGVATLYRGEAGYPTHLAELEDAPDVLFMRGALPVRPAVAVVGTRRASSYGLRVARSFGWALARAGWPVVSGLARGIDGRAHQGCVDEGGAGVAVLGCGPDIVYPREHASLAAALVDGGGAVVTEYPPGTPPEGWRFPPRNRIISGLAGAVVVVEARVTGGALITASAALSQGRAVFAVPGDVDRETSEGCNRLVRDGAHPVLGPADLIEELSLVLGPPPQPTGQDGDPDDPVLAALGPTGCSLEVLIGRIGSPAAEVLAAVARLESEGRAVREGATIIPSR